MPQHIRDRLQIDQAMLDQYAGKRLYLAARRINIIGDVTSHASELVIIADELDASGWIRAAGRAGTPGRPGANGRHGTPSQNHVAGGNGRPGGPGGMGEPGREVRVYAQHLIALSGIDCQGGKGGNGGSGGDGGDGASWQRWVGTGGSGGDGGNGGDGAAGGQVTLVCVQSDVAPTLLANGGAGGNHGAGGRAGRDGSSQELEPVTVGVFGSDGNRGNPGNKGADGQVVNDTVRPSEFYRRIRRDQGALALAWGHYRGKYAEWLFRTASDRSGQREQALQEAESSIALQRSNSSLIRPPTLDLTNFPLRTTQGLLQAEQVRDLILWHQTPIGLPWDYDPLYGFPHYEASLLRYRDVLKNAITDALDHLRTNLVIDRLREVFGLIATQAQQAGLAFAIDESLVAAKQAATASELSQVESRYEANRREQQRRRQELEAASVINALGSIVQTALAIGTAIAAAFAVVSAIAAIPGAIVKVRGAIRRSEDDLIRTIVDFDKDMPELRPEFKAAYDDVASLFKTSAALFDAVKTVEAIRQATADGQLNSLLAEAAELLVKKAKLNTQSAQQKIEMEAVKLRKDQAKILEDRALDAVMSTGAVQNQLGEMCLRLLMQVRLYADTVHRYHFEAARAIQRWKFDETASSIFFGFGWVDPDVEAAFLEAPINSTSITGLLNGVINSTNRLELLPLRRTWDDLTANPNDPLQYDSVSVPLQVGVLNQLSTTGTTSLSVALSDLPQSVRRGAHVEAVLIHIEPRGALRVDVSAEPEWTALAQDRSGRHGTEQRRSLMMQPEASAQALDDHIRHELSRLTSHGPAEMNRWWGCSPARRWSLRLEGSPGEMARVTVARFVLVVSGHRDF